MSGFFSEKRHIVIVALTVISAIAIGCMSAFMITAAPEDSAAPQLLTRDSAARITSPLASEPTSLPESDIVTYSEAPTEDTTGIDTESDEGSEILADTDIEDEYTVVTAESFTASAPEIETEAQETTAPETEAVTEPAIETELETEAETEPETVAETEAAPLFPELPEGYLADELGVDYTLRTPMYEVTEQELVYVATIVQLEVMGSGSRLYSFEDIPEKYTEMLAVAQCIRNRMESRRFPNSASGVIFQCGKNGSGNFVYQFYSEDVLSLYEPTYEAYVAAYEVLCEGLTVLPTNYYYFCATRICDYFENTNYAALNRNSDGSFDKFTGHLTTFYGGY